MTVALHLMVRSSVSMREVDAQTMVFEGKRLLHLRGLSPGVRAALELLASRGAAEEELCRVAEEIDGHSAATWRVLYYVLKLLQNAVLQYALRSGDALLATIECVQNIERIPGSIRPINGSLVLSRFAYIRKHVDKAILESPLCRGRIVVSDPECFATIFRLMQPRTCEELLSLTPRAWRDEVLAFVTVLQALSIVREGDQDDEGDSRYWEFHDLMFHSQTRFWEDSKPLGATFRFGMDSRQQFSELDARLCSESIELFQPDLAILIRSDRSFTEVLEARRSLRGASGPAISAEQLGEFLYRVAGTRSFNKLVHAEDYRGNRPYPNAGACYELEIYVLVDRCEGLAGGLYHYRPDTHRLTAIRTNSYCLTQMLRDAGTAAGCVTPEVLVIVTARFRRVSWKYEGIAYSLILKNVGVLFQTMYLVATAMRMRPCAVGAGDARLFEQATGIEGLTEASVGEFVLMGRVPVE
jgi:oxazoline/thiazoline dehydrogenase